MSSRISLNHPLFILAMLFGSGCHGIKASDAAGRVLDSSSGHPVAGAYVLAAYTVNVGVVFGHNSTSCTATRGMYTSADGSFSFPAVKDRQIELYVIKPGFQQDIGRQVVMQQDGSRKRQVLLPDLFLRATPGGDGGINFAFICTGAKPNSKADLIANFEYLKLVHAETKKYGSPALQESVNQKIIGLEGLSK